METFTRTTEGEHMNYTIKIRCAECKDIIRELEVDSEPIYEYSDTICLFCFAKKYPEIFKQEYGIKLYNVLKETT